LGTSGRAAEDGCEEGPERSQRKSAIHRAALP